MVGLWENMQSNPASNLGTKSQQEKNNHCELTGYQIYKKISLEQKLGVAGVWPQIIILE